nr:MAG TPA: hypothetical protein [Caudoviricetes sp.]
MARLTLSFTDWSLYTSIATLYASRYFWAKSFA